MGKNLVIKNADFSANAVEVITPTPVDPITTKLSGNFVFFMDYNNAKQIQQKTPSSSTVANTKLLVADVQEFVGRTVRITSANYVVSGAYYDCFASDLGTLSFNNIPNLTSANPEVKTNITVIESFNVTTTTTGAVSTVTKVIPTGAKYLCVTARFDEGLTQEQLKVILID